jgi:hypothetical protein
MKSTIALAFVLAVLAAAVVEAAAQNQKELPAAVKEILDKVEQFDLYSLEPEPTKEQKAGKSTKLHGWLILGKTTVKDARTRQGLLKALEKRSRRGGAKCFDPRHAIRATHGGKTVDLLICFECSWIYVYEGGKHTSTLTVDGGVQPAFDKVLPAAKVPLARKRKGE